MKNLKRILVYCVVSASFIGAFYAVNRSQDIIDWWKLRDYEPSSRIVAIAETSGFNDYGKRLFYVHDPTILNDKLQFAESCRTSNEIIVLGCHITNQDIFIFDVQDERLNGIVEVTAAHEMLHAAFDRLSLDEQEDIVNQLQSFYDELKLENERLRKTIESYAKRDSTIVGNELHSIIGSEIRELPAALETYYSRYFDDRLAVVAFAEAYEAEFIKREQQIASFDTQLDGLNSEIVRLQADITLQSEALTTEKQLLDALRGNPEAFNAGVGPYNSKVNAYNADVVRLKQFIDDYNRLVAERNEIAIEERELVEAIDSRVDTL